MKTHFSRGLRRALTGIVPVLALLTVTALPAMAQTRAGTPISNTASVDWTDANTNDYTAAESTVVVTVAFDAGVGVVAPGAFAPAVGAASSATFTVSNLGNDVDSLEVTGVTNTDGSVLVIDSYEATLPGGGAVPGGPFATLADLNAALAGIAVDIGESITITVNFTTQAGSGGTPTDLGLTVASREDGTTTATDSVTITPGGYLVANGPSSSELPGTHTVVFDVTSTVPGGEDVDLAAALSLNTVGATITGIGEVGGVVFPGADTTIAFAEGQTRQIEVTYTLPITSTPGQSVTIQLTATGVTSTLSDAQDTPPVITLTRPEMTISKTISSSSDGTGAAPASVVPGDVFWYVITITNTGDAAATTVTLTDALPTEVTFQAFETGSGAAFDGTPLAHDGSATGGTVSGVISSLPSTGTDFATVIVRVVVN